MTAYPRLLQVVLDATDIRPLAEFYRQMFGLEYRAGDEQDRDQDWLVLRDPRGGMQVAFQQVDALPEPTWPDPPIPQQLHLDTAVPSLADLERQHERAVSLGARVLHDRRADPDEPLLVYADPAGHPFCIFVE